MVHLHKQKNRNKSGFNRIKSKDKKSLSRHNRLASAAAAQRNGKTASQKNEDLFFSPIDEYMKQNFGSESGDKKKTEVVEGESDGNDSSDSRDSVPALTGNTHILMERDFFEKKYELEQNG